MMQLKKLRVKKCRGIIDGPEINLGSGGALICGDNGTGKSSYIDALELLLTGNCSSLDKVAQGLSWKQQGAHILAETPPEIELDLTDGNQSYTITLGSSPKSSKIRSFLQNTQNSSFILRRRTMLDFIESKPAERWKTLEHILNIDRYKEFEKELIELDKTLLEDIKTEDQVIRDNENEIKKQFEIQINESIEQSEIIDKINEKANELNLEKISAYKDIDNLLSRIGDQISTFSKIEEWNKLSRLKNLLEKASIQQDLIEEFRDYSKKIKEFEDETKKLIGHFHIEVLQQGFQWIQEDKLTNCPLCGNEIKFEEVNSYIKQKLEKHANIIKLKEECDVIRSNLDDKFQPFISEINEIHDLIEKDYKSDYEVKFEVLRVKLNKINECYAKIETYEIVQKYLNFIEKLGDNSILNLMSEEIDKKLQSSPDLNKFRELYNFQSLLNKFKFHHKNIENSKLKVKNLKFCQNQTNCLCRLATEARKNTIQLLMKSISDTADEYYQYIHPNESIGSPKIIVKQQQNASLDLKSEFYGKIEDPRGHYSEGHVDSLGLCIFLAIRRFQSQLYPGINLLVLDDVLHSVDGTHRQKTAEMIFEKFNDHQILITTHDPLWFEKLKTASNIHMRGKKLAKYKISAWTLNEGPIFGDHLNEYEWLISEKSRTASPQDNTIKTGRLLEAMLKDLCHNLKISVPFNNTGLYTLEPLWSSFYPKAKQFKDFYLVADTNLNLIEATHHQRNWIGAHYNEWALGITNKEANDFKDAVIELRELVYCDSCGKFIKRIEGPKKTWACECQNIKYEDNTKK